MQTVVVTGGAHGIGRAACERFAREGFHVAILDIDQEVGVDVAREINDEGGSATFWHTDIGDPENVKTTVAGIMEDRGNIEALVSNAAIINRGTLETLTLEEWDEQVRVNLTGSFLISREVAHHMMKAKSGAIVHVSSITGTHGGDNRVGYIATKGGVLAMSMSIALDLAPHGIRVNAVAPGTVATRLTKPALSDPERAPKILAGIPIGRAAEPEDIADVIYFLCTDDARYMVGSVVTVDGGICAAP